MSSVSTKLFRGWIQRALAGVSPTVALPPTQSGRPVSQGLYDETARVFYQLVTSALGVRTWEVLGGPGAPSLLGWSRYVVSAQATPVAPYTTISAAIAAAVADGHTDAAPATVLVMPGAYTEAVTLQPGISVAALSQATCQPEAAAPHGLDVTITGLVSFAGTGTVSLTGLRIVGRLNLSGAGAQTVTVRNCAVTPGAGFMPTTITNTNAATRLAFERCRVAAADNSGVAQTIAAPALLSFTDCYLESGTTGRINLNTAAAVLLLNRCFCAAGVTIAAGASAQITRSTLFGTMASLLNNAGTVEWVRSQMDSTGATPFGGAGTVTYYDVDIGTGLIWTKAAGATVSPLPIVRGLVRAAQAGAGTMAAAYCDILLVDTAGANIAVTLRAQSTYPDGYGVIIKSVHAAGDIAVTPQAAEEIDGLGAGNPYTIAAGGTGFGSKAFVLDRANARWYSY